MHTSIKISENFNIYNGAKQIYPKKQKKILIRDTLGIQ